jgi:hypothetical protein
MPEYPFYSDMKCPICGEFIIITRERDWKKKFCGLPCYMRSRKDDPTQEWVRRPYVIKSCIECKKQFVTDTDQVFCSKRCAKIKHIMAECPTCKKEFRVKNSHDLKRGRGKYCSDECKKRKYNLNQEYFNEINSENADVLGYIWAMGLINSKNELVFYDTIEKLTWFSDKINNEYLIRPMPRVGKDIHFLKIRFCNRLINRLRELGFDDGQLNTVFPEIVSKEEFIKGLLFNNNSKKFKLNGFNLIETRFKSEKLVNELCNLLTVIKRERFGGYWILHIKA